MKKSRWLVICCCMLALIACGGISQQQREHVELLNHRAFDLRYTSLDSIEYYASQALLESDGYAQGMAESYNNLALAAYMRQDFTEAEKYYNLAKRSTHNQIDLLMSDIGMLKVCSRKSDNKRFYDFETQIHNRLSRIHKEQDVLNAHDISLLIYAESDFHLTTSIYYYYMQHDQKAKQELNQIDGLALAASDSIQWAYYEYMKASVSMLGGNTFEEDVKLEFDTLLKLLFFAREKGLIYIEANVLETFVDKLAKPNWYTVALQNRGADFIYLHPDEVSDTILTEHISKEALRCFETYGDYYQISSARRRLSDIYFLHAKYEDAFKEQLAAIEDINNHFDKYNKYSDYQGHIYAYNPNDTLEVDVLWMEDESVSTVPQWLANLRQSLSLTYAALGNKTASDYNRNVYLDLLEKTRQDKEQESRLDQLNKETKSLTLLFWVIIAITIIGGTLLFHLNRNWVKRNNIRIRKLNEAALLCNRITSNIPTEVDDKEELLKVMLETVKPELERLFEQSIEILHHTDDDTIILSAPSSVNKDDKDLLSLIEPYLNWAYQYGSNFINLDEEYKQLEKERYLHEQHIADNKRKNLEKRTCMSIVTGITPYLDRARNEINRLKSGSTSLEQKQERYTYIQELIQRINEYNEILALWIKMKQGALSLQVESFPLNDIFTTISKGKHSYDVKGIQFTVDETAAVIKADKALTLFMINTLCENARKYTPQGGFVHLNATETSDYVEISVKDTGRGLSPEDRKLILEEKVYDSSKIGLSQDDDTDLKQNKGFGFGLMNCKGIIDKYKKTNSIFSVCLFDIESKLGEGSRFFFRLPKGVMRLFIGIFFFLSAFPSEARTETDQMLLKATAYADSTYYSNIDGLYESAFIYADSACYYLNKYYLSQFPNSKSLLYIDSNELIELEWLEKGVNTDYHIILDIRNEVAVAALALGEWEIYKINNDGYTRLYKILSEDKTLDLFCEQMQNSANTKTLSIFLILILLLVFLILFYSFYFRQLLIYRINIRQILEANHKVMESFNIKTDSSDSNLIDMQGNMLKRIYPDLNAIHTLEGLAIQIKDPDDNVFPIAITDTELLTHELEIGFIQVMDSLDEIHDRNHHFTIYPLLMKQKEKSTCIGAIAFIQNTQLTDKNEVIFRDLIINYISIVMYQSVIRLTHKRTELEEAEDEKRRAIHEENLLHVQNMVLDNCLSALKHETMYYPNRIKQIVDKLIHEKESTKIEEQTLVMSELMNYYKEIFSTLSDCASRQLENLKFSRKSVSVIDIQKHLEKYFRKVVRKNQLDWVLEMNSVSYSVLGDENLLCYMMENLVDATLEKNECHTGLFRFFCQKEEGFVRFTFEDPRGVYKQEDLNLLFYPDLNRMQVDDSGFLHGTQYLNMRQIIRDHDELCRHRGCRINAEVLESGGYCIWFTLPQSKNE